MLKYTSRDIQDCLGGRRVVFAGDSTIRQVFWGFAERLGIPLAVKSEAAREGSESKHKNLSFDKEGVRLEFIWDPWLNSTELTDMRKSLNNEFHPAVENPVEADLHTPPRNNDRPALVVLGSPGLWAVHYGGEEYFDIFRENVDHVIGELAGSLDKKIVKPSHSSEKNYKDAADMILLAPVQIPAYDKLSPDRSTTIKPQKVEGMNAYLSNVTREESTHILWAFNQMTKLEVVFGEDGLHVVDSVAQNQADLVLNARCNAPAAGRRDARKSTCCASYPKVHFATVLLITGLSVVFPRFLEYLFSDSHRGWQRPFEFMTAAGQLLFAVAWCHLTDRSGLFAKSTRHFHQFFFVLLSQCWLAASILSLSSVSLEGRSLLASGFLSRQQSEEIKGLMQAFILLYHYHYGSQTYWVYVTVRVLISMYFFLSAYGHSTFLLKKGDFSFRRVATILFRINALAALLPYAMNTDYMSYYFAPVITFWYLVVYFTLRTCPDWNHEMSGLLFKVFVAAVLVNFLIVAPGILELASTVSHAIFRMSWAAEELRFRLKLDRFIVFVGIVVAGATQRVTHLRASHGVYRGHSIDENTCMLASGFDDILHIVAEGKERWYTVLKPVMMSLSTTSIPLFILISMSGYVGTKERYNALHPWISWMPILAFIALRNAIPALRLKYLRLPTALGRIALETYVLQYHMWLGDDATSLLSTGLFSTYTSWQKGTFVGLGKLIESVAFTVCFLAMAASTHHATEVLSQWLFSPPCSRVGYESMSIPAFSFRRNSRGPLDRVKNGSRRGLTSSLESSESEALVEMGQMFEMDDLDGREIRSMAASSSSSSSLSSGLTVAGGQPDGSEYIRPEGDDDGGENKPMFPELIIRAQPARPPFLQRLRGLSISRSVVAILDSYDIDATELFEDPRLRALALVLPLWILNWFYP